MLTKFHTNTRWPGILFSFSLYCVCVHICKYICIRAYFKNECKCIQFTIKYILSVFLSPNLILKPFLKCLSIQLFQKKDLPFNGKSAFHHKDKTQCAQLILPSRRFLFYHEYLASRKDRFQKKMHFRHERTELC